MPLTVPEKQNDALCFDCGQGEGLALSDRLQSQQPIEPRSNGLLGWAHVSRRNRLRGGESVSADALALEAAELVHLVLAKSCRLYQGKQIPIEIGLLAD
jgi:hypothetical protein